MSQNSIVADIGAGTGILTKQVKANSSIIQELNIDSVN